MASLKPSWRATSPTSSTDEANSGVGGSSLNPASNESVRVVPDWICEILSPSTRAHDQLVKRRFYARVGVPYLWFIDPDARTLSVCTLREGHWVELGVYGQNERIRAEPFAAVELNLADWWLPEAPVG
jgi:Uma2 family endonuclease